MKFALVTLSRYADFDFSLKARSDETLSQNSAAGRRRAVRYQDDGDHQCLRDRIGSYIDAASFDDPGVGRITPWPRRPSAPDDGLSPITATCGSLHHTRCRTSLPGPVRLTHHHLMWALHRLALVALVSGAATHAVAGEASSGRMLLQPPSQTIPSPITDRFAVTARFNAPMMETFFRYDDPDNANDFGTPFYVEDTLGLKSKLYQGSIDMMFRIGERHRIHSQYSQQTRSAVQALDLGEPLLFGSSEFDDGDVVQSEMQQRKLDLVYTYSVLRRQRVELGLGLGMHLLQFSGTLAEPAEFVTETLDTAGPAASLAADFTWRITRRFSLTAQGQWLRGNVSDVEAEYRFYRGSLQYRAARNMAIGIGYSGTYYEVDSADPDFFRGYLWIHNHGPEAFIRVSF